MTSRMETTTEGVTVGDATAIPRMPAGWHQLTWFVTVDGRLGQVMASEDVHAAWRAKRDAHPSDSAWIEPDASSDVARAGARARIRLIRPDGSVDEGPEFALGYPWITADLLPDGRWMVAELRAFGDGYNGRVLRPDGTVETRIRLGDGIEQMQTGPDGSIWVGYFDEGIFGDSGWPPGEKPEFASSGLARLTADGSVRWWYRGQIDSLCAMNVGPTGELWATYYVDFPMLNVRGSEERYWPTGFSGVEAIAVDDEHLLLVDGYGQDRDCVLLARIDADRPIATKRLYLLSAEGTPLLPGSFRNARGRVLHVVDGQTWYRVDLRDLRDLRRQAGT